MPLCHIFSHFHEPCKIPSIYTGKPITSGFEDVDTVVSTRTSNLQDYAELVGDVVEDFLDIVAFHRSLPP